MVDVLQAVVIDAVAVGARGSIMIRRAASASEHDRFAFLAQTLRIAIPYLFAASGVMSERSGLIGLGLGDMLGGAFCGALAALTRESVDRSRWSNGRRRCAGAHLCRGSDSLSRRPSGGGHRGEPARCRSDAVFSPARVPQLGELSARSWIRR
jgi:hypothetical protein